MKAVNWLFGVSALLFVFGIGFVVVGAREARRAQASAAAPAVVQNVATVKQLMTAVAAPAADAIFNAVQTNVTEKGVEEIEPKNDQEWEALEARAASLAEVGNLMLTEGRAVDRGDWITMSEALVAASKKAAQAAARKNKDAILETGGDVNLACDNCHMRYRRQ